MTSRLKTHWIVLLPFVVAGGLSVYLLMSDLDDQEQYHRSQPIGHLIRLYGRIRLKPQGAFVWKETKVGQPLFRGDLLIAGADSTALIQMEGGQELQIEPGSSVILDQMKNLTGPAIKGSVLLHEPGGKVRYLSNGDRSSVAAEVFPVQLDFPEELGELFVRDGAATTVRFSWQQNQISSTKKILEISGDRLFQGKDRRAVPVDGKASDTEAVISEGRKFWRLTDPTGKAISATRQFNAHTVKGVNAAIPDGTVISWNNSVDFRWIYNLEEENQFGTHSIQISPFPDFHSLARMDSIPVASLQATLSDIPEGKYYWRITSRYSNLTVSGASRKFVVERGKQLSIVPVLPIENAVVPISGELFFRWVSNSQKAQFTLELETEDGRPVVKTESLAPERSVPDISPGQYRWRTIGKLGTLRSETAWRHLSVLRAGGISLKLPKPGERVTVGGIGDPVEFEWESAGAVKDSYYQLELATDPDFRNVVGRKNSKVARTSSVEFNLTPNLDYFWRVAFVSSGGTGLQISAPSGFHFYIYRGLAAPRDLLPQPDAVCNPLRIKEQCNLSWSPLPGASHYEIEIFKADEFERAPASKNHSLKSAVRTPVKEAFYQTKALSDGSYYWRVRAYDEKHRPGAPSEPQRFHVTLGAPLLAPRVKSTEVQ